jgi:UDP-N-acetylglucosamine 4,6-dehydratase
MLNGKTILITGGTGSFGQAFINKVLYKYPEVAKIIIYSRDELKQSDMRESYDKETLKKLRYFIGDVRDKDRLKLACENVDIIIHAAALKQVPAAEYNPMECIKTNVLGAENVISVALECNVEKVIALSTDKAAAPINLYGATKLCSDKLFIAANNIKGKRDIKFFVVRYGNVFGSRGSVLPFFQKVKDQGKLPITDESMTRFSITLENACQFVLKCLDITWGGEIFVPKIPSYRILDMAKAVSSSAEIEIIGPRPGEKIHEEMITVTDSLNTLEFGDYFVILPSLELWNIDSYLKEFSGKRVKQGFHYYSGGNEHFLSVQELRDLIEAKAT